MSKWRYTKGLKDIGNGVWAYLLPDGSWGWSNAGLIVDGDQTLLVDTLFDLKLTAEMLAEMRRSVPAAEHINTLFNTHHNGDHTFGNQLVDGAEIVATNATFDEMDPTHPALYHSMMVNAKQLGRGATMTAALRGAHSKSRARARDLRRPSAFPVELRRSQPQFRGFLSSPPTSPNTR